MNSPYDTHILQDGMRVILTQSKQDPFPVWVICDIDVVTDRMIEARQVPNSFVFNKDTPEQALLRTWNHFGRMLTAHELRGVEIDMEGFEKAIQQLVEISNKPVEVWMERIK